MKFSVLIPTRDRLQLLRLAVATVLRQDYEDWEIIVADNASAEDVQGFVASLNDPRVRYTRSEESLPVTENWNRALALATGDYVVMLGDDDGLLQGYFRENRIAIEQHASPDLIFVQGVQFVYAGVMPGFARSFIQVANCEFIKDETSPFPLPKETAVDMVRKSAGFVVAFPYNMQYSLVARELVQRMSAKGPFFQSPYPDYYATNSLLLEARRILVQPLPLVAIGISPKSFGYYYFNKRENEGVQMLQGPPRTSAFEDRRKGVIPGSDMNTSWLLAMEAVCRNWPGHAIKLHRDRYRFLQMKLAYLRAPRFREFALRYLLRHASLREIIYWVRLHMKIAKAVRGKTEREIGEIRARMLDQAHCAYPKVKIYVKEVGLADIVDLQKSIEPKVLLQQLVDHYKTEHREPR